MKNTKRTYQELAVRIADDWSEHLLPPPVMHYYLLAELIGMGSFETFTEAYGPQPIEAKLADQGKDEFLNLGSFTRFGLDSIQLLMTHVSTKKSD